MKKRIAASMHRRPRAGHAFTLVEVLFAAVLTAVALAALAQALASGQALTYAALHDVRAQTVAESTIEQVLALPYKDPDGPSLAGPEADESTPASFDNADDFDGFTEPAGSLTDVVGNLYPPQYQEFSRAVSAEYGTGSVDGGTPVPGLIVTVTVTDADGRTWGLTRFIREPAS
jgi:type II secretory pathway pseudopilin PulG